MDQPFSGLAKELFEVQHYPQAILDGSAKPVTLPYDVTGWTLPMQMGVRVDAVTDPVSDDQRSALELVSKIDTALRERRRRRTNLHPQPQTRRQLHGRQRHPRLGRLGGICAR